LDWSCVGGDVVVIRDRRGQVSPFPIWLAGVVALIVFAIVAYDVVASMSVPTVNHAPQLGVAGLTLLALVAWFFRDFVLGVR